MNQTRLTKTDLNNIEAEVSMLVGNAPTLEDIQGEGYSQNESLIRVLDGISGLGRIATLIAAELIQAVGAIAIALVFALIEWQRVEAGAIALGQLPEKAGLIAFAVVTANVVHPIYSLRQLRGHTHLQRTLMTGRGYWDAFKHRILGQPQTEDLDIYHNPRLHFAAAVITWSTIILAIYDILGPLLTEIATDTLSKPLIIGGMELVMGLGLSIGGVFFLQSASHEIGVRILTDQPQRLTTILEQRQGDYEARMDATRELVRIRYMEAKLEDQARKESDIPFGNGLHTMGDHANGVTMLTNNGHTANGKNHS